MKPLTKVLIAAGVVAVLGGGAAFAFFGKQRKLDERDLATVERGDIHVTVAETGIVEPLAKVEVKSRIAGQVKRVLVDVGDKVVKGQPIILLDTTESERELARAEADVAAAKANLARLLAGPRPEERAEARADLALAETEYARASAEFKRSRPAQEAGTLTVRELDQIRADYIGSQARLSAARARLARIMAGSRIEDIDQARAQLKRAEVALQSARDQLGYGTIRATMTGVVIKRGIEPGEFVSPGVSALAQGGAIMTIADLSKLVITSNLNQVDIGKVRKGLPVDVRVDSAPGRVFHGRISKVAPAADEKPASNNQNSIQTFTVETLVADKDTDASILKPGMTADLDIQVQTRKNVLWLPVEAVVRGRGDEATVTLPGKPGEHGDGEGKHRGKGDRGPGLREGRGDGATGAQGPSARVSRRGVRFGGGPVGMGDKGGKGPGSVDGVTRKIRIGVANDYQVEILEGLQEGDKVLIRPPSAADNSMKF